MNKQQTKFKDTETRLRSSSGGQVGQIPEDWEAKELGNICNVLMGQSPPSATYNTEREGLPFFQGRKDFGNKYPEKTMWCSMPKRIAEKDSVLLSVRAPIGDVNVAVEKSCIGRGVAALSMKKGDNEFLFYLMKQNQNILKNTFESGGTVFGCVNKTGLYKYGKWVFV